MKNDIISLEITDITPDGFGVGRYENKVVFVADTAIGDIISAKILKELKSHSFAKLEEILTPSPQRINPVCPVFSKCGGCSLQHISYSSELELKQSFVKQAFARIGGMDIKVNPTVFGNDTEYRNKVQYPFGRGDKNECVFGYYARRSHRIVCHERCALQEQIFSDIASYCATVAEKLFIRAYNEETAKGVLRHIVMRKNRKGEILVCLVVAEKHKKLPLLADEIIKQFSSVIGVHINVNSRRDNVIFGNETYCLAGSETLTDTLCGKVFEISPRSFYQINAEMAEKLYSHGKSLIPKSEKPRIILDLYCGAGTIGICVANEEDKLCGVEIIDSAIENAKKNALLNGRSEDNTLFVCGDASVGVRECKNRFGNPEIIILDPPRKGLESEVVATVIEASPKYILYISCDPATLARDCAMFKEAGYTASEATPFDLFPRTGHVESVVLLERTDSAI